MENHGQIVQREAGQVICVPEQSLFYDTESTLVTPIHRNVFQDPLWMAGSMDGI